MNAKQRIQSQLEQARAFSEELLAGFRTPEQWLHQVHSQANHALWFAGHMGVSDNFFISRVAPDRSLDRPDLNSRFGMGSQPTGNAADYPPIEDVLKYMRERRRVLTQILDALSAEDLAKPTLNGTPDFLPDYAAVFQMALWHEGLHSGQVSVASRSLGHAPLLGRRA